jgi:hypothetical protein
LKQITLSLVFYGYEPIVFRSAFVSGWIPFPKPGPFSKRGEENLEIKEEDEDNYEDKTEGNKLS